MWRGNVTGVLLGDRDWRVRASSRSGDNGARGCANARAVHQLSAYLGEIASANLRQWKGIRRDVNGAEGVMKDETIATMIAGLSRLMVVEDLPASAPALRSRTRPRAAFVRHFVDPSLAVAAVVAVLRGIRVFSQAHDARTFPYRDESGQEVNIVIEFPDGRWIAVAVKLGHSQVDQAAANRIAPRDHVAAVCTR